MGKAVIVYLHGFASSARSAKARYFAARFAALPPGDFYAIDLNPTPKDFEYMTTTGQIDRLRQYVLDHLPQRGSRSPERAGRCTARVWPLRRCASTSGAGR